MKDSCLTNIVPEKLTIIVSTLRIITKIAVTTPCNTLVGREGSGPLGLVEEHGLVQDLSEVIPASGALTRASGTFGWCLCWCFCWCLCWCFCWSFSGCLGGVIAETTCLLAVLLASVPLTAFILVGAFDAAKVGSLLFKNLRVVLAWSAGGGRLGGGLGGGLGGSL